MRLALLLLFLFVPSALAIGFANPPENREVIFTPNGVVSYDLYVINDPHIAVGVSTPYASDPATKGTPGDDNILDYIALDDPAPGTGPRRVTLTFSFPESMRPGEYQIDVSASQQPPESQATITALASMKLILRVYVYSDEKIIEAIGPHVPPIAEGLRANASVFVVSRTTQDIDDVHGEIRVYDREGTPVTRGETGSTSLSSGSSASIVAYLDTAVLPGGEYDVNGTIWYDGERTELGTVTLKIGKLHVGIPAFTETLTYNATNKFDFNVENQWNRELKDVYAFARLAGQEKKTASQAIPPFGTTHYEVYFDRDPEVAPGTHRVNVSVHYEDFDPATGQYVEKIESFLLPVRVTIPPGEETPGASPYVVVLIAIGSLLVFLLVIALIFLARRPERAYRP